MDVARDVAVAFPDPRAPIAPRESLLDLIGNTPLLRVRRIGAAFPNIEFYAKAEWLNPGGSVKDRPALQIIREAERSGQLRPTRWTPPSPSTELKWRRHSCLRSVPIFVFRFSLFSVFSVSTFTSTSSG